MIKLGFKLRPFGSRTQAIIKTWEPELNGVTRSQGKMEFQEENRLLLGKAETAGKGKAQKVKSHWVKGSVDEWRKDYQQLPSCVLWVLYRLSCKSPTPLRSRWLLCLIEKKQSLGFPGGSVAQWLRNAPAKAGNKGSIPDLGRSHMRQNN